MASQSIQATLIRGRAACLTLEPDGKIAVAVAGKSTTIHRWPDAESFAAAFRRRELRIRRWALVVPRSECLLKQAVLPTNDPVEAATMLSFEIPELLPIRSEEAHYDSVSLGTDARDHIRLAVWLLLDARLGRYLEVLSTLGIEPVAVVPTSLGIHLSVASRLEARRSDRRLVIAANSREYEVLLTEDDRLLWSRQFSMPESSAPDFALIVNEALRADCQGDSNGVLAPTGVEQIVLIGPADRIGALEHQARELISLGGEPSSPVVEVLREEDGEPSADWVHDRCLRNVAQAISDGMDIHPNLLPNRLIDLRNARGRRRQLVAVCALALLVGLLGWSFLALGTWRLERRLRELNAAIMPIQDVATELERKKQQLRAVQEQLNLRDLPLRVMADLYQHVPDRLSLSDVTIAMRPGGADVVLRGIAPAVHDAYELPGHLRRSELLRGIRVVRADSIGGDTEAATFECRAQAGAR